MREDDEADLLFRLSFFHLTGAEPCVYIEYLAGILAACSHRAEQISATSGSGSIDGAIRDEGKRQCLAAAISCRTISLCRFTDLLWHLLWHLCPPSLAILTSHSSHSIAQISNTSPPSVYILDVRSYVISLRAQSDKPTLVIPLACRHMQDERPGALRSCSETRKSRFSDRD